MALMIPGLPNELVQHILFFVDDPKFWIELRSVSKAWRAYIDFYIFRRIQRIEIVVTLLRSPPLGEFPSVVFISGSGIPRIQMNGHSDLFQECLRQCWIRSSQCEEFCIRSYENLLTDIGIVTGPTCSFRSSLNLVQVLNSSHPRHIRTFEYLPALFQKELYPLDLVLSWRACLVKLRILDGGGQLAFWADILYENHLRELSLDICPTADHHSELDFFHVRQILDQSDQPLQRLELAFCPSDSHVSEESRVNLASMVLNRLPTERLHLEFPPFPFNLIHHPGWVRGILNVGTILSPKTPCQLALRTLSLGEFAGDVQFTHNFLRAFPNLNRIEGLRCNWYLAQKLPAILLHYRLHNWDLLFSISCQPVADSDENYKRFLLSIMSMKVDPASAGYWVEIHTRGHSGENVAYTLVQIVNKSRRLAPACSFTIVIPVTEGTV
jgi:hypothetical protein